MAAAIRFAEPSVYQDLYTMNREFNGVSGQACPPADGGELEHNLQARGVSEIKILTGAGNNAAQKVYQSSGYTSMYKIVFCKKL